MKITEISKCRICGNTDLISLMDLGEQPLSGLFPQINAEDPPCSPLHLVKCNPEHNHNACGLVQLKHSVDPGEMFRNNYGYLSGMNHTMTDHLGSITAKIEQHIKLHKGDSVIDIGSNDGTLLKSYQTKGINRIGIDPGGKQYKKYYPEDIQLITDFFPSKLYTGEKAKVITSISMFYDLEDPMAFVKSIKENLHKDGIWVLEQSYLPTMLESHAFDTICHEHLEYYALAQITWMVVRNGLKVVDVETNHINGGSFRVYVSHSQSEIPENNSHISNMELFESSQKLNTEIPYKEFKDNVERIKEKTMKFIDAEILKGKKIYVYGASTKGNILLNYYGLTEKTIAAAADRNPNKWTCKTPGSHIPIISEDTMRRVNPDYLLVLPWHFKKEFIDREKEFLENGGKFIFPLPECEVVGSCKHGV